MAKVTVTLQLLCYTLADIMAKWLHFLLSCFLLSVPLALGVELELVVMVSNADVFDTSQVIPAVNLALEAVNNWSLPFTLSYNATLHSQVSTNALNIAVCVRVCVCAVASTGCV